MEGFPAFQRGRRESLRISWNELKNLKNNFPRKQVLRMFCQTHKTTSEGGRENTRFDFLLINLKFIDFHFRAVRASWGLPSMPVYAASPREVKVQVGSLCSFWHRNVFTPPSDTFVNSRIIKSQSEDVLMHARKRFLLASRIMFAHRVSNFHKIIFSS